MCTTIGFAYKEGQVFGRTLEVGVELDNKVLFVPKETKDFIKTADGTFSSKYAVLGTGYFDIPSFGDGINEKGLMGSNNLFPGYASFAKEKEEGKVNLTTSNAFDYLLSRCENVEEVKKEAANLRIVERGATKEDTAASNHFFFMDESGAKIVLEPKEGRLIPYDNPFGILTNAPDFSWHTTNLKNYIHLQPENIEERSFNGTSVSKFGEGTGMLGLPGDFTPPSRFIRSAYFVSETPKDLKRNDAILEAFRILSQADIPTGAVIDPKNGYKDETLYTGVMDTKKKAYFVKCHNNIDLQAFYLDDFQEKKEITFVEWKKEMVL